MLHSGSSMFRIVFTPEAIDDLRQFRKYDQQHVVAAIETQLLHQPAHRRAIGNDYVLMPWRNGNSVSRRFASSMMSMWRKASSKLQPWGIKKAISSSSTARNTSYESYPCFTTRNGD